MPQATPKLGLLIHIIFLAASYVAAGQYTYRSTQTHRLKTLAVTNKSGQESSELVYYDSVMGEITTLKCSTDANNNKCDYQYCQCLIKHYKDLPCWTQEVGLNMYWDCNKSIVTNEKYAEMRNQWLMNIKSTCLAENLSCYIAKPSVVKVVDKLPTKAYTVTPPYDDRYADVDKGIGLLVMVPPKSSLIKEQKEKDVEMIHQLQDQIKGLLSEKNGNKTPEFEQDRIRLKNISSKLLEKFDEAKK